MKTSFLWVENTVWARRENKRRLFRTVLSSFPMASTTHSEVIYGGKVTLERVVDAIRMMVKNVWNAS